MKDFSINAKFCLHLYELSDKENLWYIWQTLEQLLVKTELWLSHAIFDETIIVKEYIIKFVLFMQIISIDSPSNIYMDCSK